jgi:hypothetical protein
LQEWGQFLRSEVSPGDHERRYSLYHETFAEFLRAKEQVDEWRQAVEASRQLRARAALETLLPRPAARDDE